jgi:hypothetical protein
MYRIAIRIISCLLVSNLASASEEGEAATANWLGEPVASAFQIVQLQLEVEGPGALFSSIEAAAIDALTYAYLQAHNACDSDFMRGGTIYPVGEDQYSYGEIHRANRWSLHKISYILKPGDVARFHLYPVNRDGDTNRANERPSRVDRRSVSVVDPLHRPLYILHPSLTVRAYRGDGPHSVEVATLHRPARPRIFARKCSTQEPSLSGLARSSRIAETSRPVPSILDGSSSRNR